ncbi:MAG TPA: hypothetical protein VKA70_01390 [Blastocatellia bacterium]|nr:hypothetical protein [Blastocatellia bacterium]
MRITVRALETVGPVERVYDLYTSDPRNRVVKLTLRADVKPLPDFVRRIANSNIGHGEAAGSFNVWPAANPVVAAARGESVKLSLRIRPTAPGTGELQLLNDNGGRYRLRREANKDGYWLDIESGPINEPGSHKQAIQLQTAGASQTQLTLNLTVNIAAENLIATPASLDLGELELANLKGGLPKTFRLGVRKVIGTFNIKSINSTLPFLKIERQTIVEGSNYLIKVSVDPASLPKPGPYNGLLRIETDDAQSPRVEVPIKVVFK